MSNIVKAIAKVMAEVGSVPKAGTNTFHGYKYATAADILHKLQPLMAGVGLVIFQTERERGFLGGDAAVTVTYEFVLAHESGDTWPAIIRTGMATAKNTKGGFDDKALNKCSTAALKYFLLNLFQIPTGDYDDADKDEDKPAKLPSAKPHRLEPLPPQLEPDPFGLNDPPPPDDYDDGASRLAYLEECKAKILGPKETEATIRQWWADAAQARRDFGLNNLEIGLLKSLMAERFTPAKSTKPYVPIPKVAAQ